MKSLDIRLLDERLEARIGADIAAHNICGASVIVNQDGKRVCTRHFGQADPESGRRLDDSCLYRLASMTKPIMAVTVMTLVEQGLVSLDDPVEKYLPAYAEMTLGAISPEGELICAGKSPTAPTLRHLLTHTSGIGSGAVGDRTFAMMTPEQHRTLENAVEAYAAQPLSFIPGTKQEYSPIAAFDVLARIVEVVAECDIEAYMKNKIFGPCGMNDTTFVPTDAQRARLVAMHKKTERGSEADRMPDAAVFECIPVTHPLGGGGLVSSPEDYSKFAEMLLCGGVCGENRVISAGSVAEISRVQVPLDFHPAGEHWGLGVRVISSPDYGRLPLGAYGWSGAYGTHFWVDKTNRITAIYMKNSRHDGGSGAETAANFERDVTAALI